MVYKELSEEDIGKLLRPCPKCGDKLVFFRSGHEDIEHTVECTHIRTHGYCYYDESFNEASVIHRNLK